MTRNAQLESSSRRRDVKRLAKDIVRHVRENRRVYTTLEGRRLGFSDEDLTRLFPDALVEARTTEPKLDDMAVHQ